MFSLVVILTIIGFIYYEIRYKVQTGEMTIYEWIKDWIETIAIAVIYAIAARVFFLQAFFIPTGSMIDTLKPGDRLLVNKMVYHFQKPRFLDPFVFKAPQDIYRDYIKRLVGLPGDKLKIVNGRLYRNGKRLKENYIIKKKIIKLSTNLPLKKVILSNYGIELRFKDSDYLVISYTNLRSGKLLERVEGKGEWSFGFYSSRDNYYGQAKRGDDYVKIYLLDGNGMIDMSELLSFEYQGKKYNVSQLKAKNIIYSKERKELSFTLADVKKFNLTFYCDDLVSFDHYELLAKEFTVPYKGMKVKITEDNYPYLKWAIFYEIQKFLVEKEDGSWALVDKRGKVIQDNIKEYVFKQNHYFAMGDNRNDSLDSRYWGTVPESYLLGKALILYYPFSRFKLVR